MADVRRPDSTTSVSSSANSTTHAPPHTHTQAHTSTHTHTPVAPAAAAAAPAPSSATTPAPAIRLTFDNGGVLVHEGVRFVVRSMSAACLFVPPIRSKAVMGARVWDERLRDTFGVMPKEHAFPPSIYEPMLHTARAVCFGDPVLALIYPIQGRIIAHGAANCTERLVRDTLHRAFDLVRQCAEQEVSLHAPGGGSPYKLDQIMVAVEGYDELATAMKTDILYLDKLALRFPQHCTYMPEVLPALFVKVPDSSVVVTVFENGQILVHHAQTAPQIVEGFKFLKNKIVRGGAQELVDMAAEDSSDGSESDGEKSAKSADEPMPNASRPHAGEKRSRPSSEDEDGDD